MTAAATADTDDDGDCNDAGGSTRYLYCQNNNFNVVALTDKDGVVVEKVKYDPYGTPTVTQVGGASATGNPYLFQGRRWCSETNLYYFRNRDLSPTLGRFIQRDPLGYVDGMNLYDGLTGMPTGNLDPLGRVGTGNVYAETRRRVEDFWKKYIENMKECLRDPCMGGQFNCACYRADPVSQEECRRRPCLTGSLNPACKKAAIFARLWRSELAYYTSLKVAAASPLGGLREPVREGVVDGLEINVNAYTFGISDLLGVTHAEELVKKYGGLYKAADISAKISAAAAYGAVMGRAQQVTKVLPRATYEDGGKSQILKTTSRITRRTVKVIHRVVRRGKVVHQDVKYKRFLPF